MAEEISILFPHGVVLISIMDGALPLTMDLAKKIKVDIRFDFLKSSSYVEDNKVSSPKIVYYSNVNIENQDIIIVDDIIDSGETILKAIEILEAYNPKSITIVSLLVKKTRLSVDYREIYG
jgi:hypoxanthine phosphoribosyltransferase